MSDAIRSIRLAGVMILLVVAPGCAGYRFGNRSLYPSHIHTVHVPIFESNSFRRGLGERLTEAVQKEIELKTPYKVTSNPGADSVLSGRIGRENKHVVIGSKSGEPRELQVNLHVQVQWVDRRGSPIRSTETIPVAPELIDVTGTSNVIPQMGQSIATGQQQAIHRLAEQIVSLMEAPW